MLSERESFLIAPHLHAYAGVVFSEPLSLRITPRQHWLLRGEARRRGISVSDVVREAIDLRYAGPSIARRRRALENLSRRTIPFVPINELNSLIGH